MIEHSEHWHDAKHLARYFVTLSDDDMALFFNEAMKIIDSDWNDVTYGKFLAVRMNDNIQEKGIELMKIIGECSLVPSQE